MGIINILFSIFLSFILFTIFENKYSFLKIYSDLISKPKQQIKILNKLIRNLNYSNEELAIYNMGSYKKIPYKFIYSLFIFTSTLLSIFFTFSILTKFNITGLTLVIFIFLVPTFIVSIPMIFIISKFRNFEIEINFNNLKHILYNLVKIIFIIYSIVIIYLIGLYFNSVDFNGLFLTSGLNKAITFDSIDGNQLSLAGIFFTLAMGGTIVFSVLKKQHEQINKLEMKFSELNKIYCGWIEENNENISFDFKSIKEFNIALNDLRDRIELNKIFELKEPVRLFEIFIFLIMTYYFMGFLTIVDTGLFINYYFLIGLSLLIPYFLILFMIFKYYK